MWLFPSKDWGCGTRRRNLGTGKRFLISQQLRAVLVPFFPSASRFQRLGTAGKGCLSVLTRTGGPAAPGKAQIPHLGRREWGTSIPNWHHHPSPILSGAGHGLIQPPAARLSFCWNSSAPLPLADPWLPLEHPWQIPDPPPAGKERSVCPRPLAAGPVAQRPLCAIVRRHRMCEYCSIDSALPGQGGHKAPLSVPAPGRRLDSRSVTAPLFPSHRGTARPHCAAPGAS